MQHSLERRCWILVQHRIAHYHEFHFFCYLSSHLIVNDFAIFVHLSGVIFRGLRPLNTPPLTLKNNFSDLCFLEFENQSYNKHSQNFVIRNRQNKFACFVKLICFFTVYYLFQFYELSHSKNKLSFREDVDQSFLS